jgi:hypothetical protein
MRIYHALVVMGMGLLNAMSYLFIMCLVAPVLILALGKERSDEIAEDFVLWAGK